MRTAAVQRAARCGKQLVEIRRRRDFHRFGPSPDLQAASLQHAECPLRALFNLRGIIGMPVAIGRRVDQNQKLLLAGDGGTCFAILRTDIDGGSCGRVS